MDYSYIFSSGKIKKDSLKAAGFCSSDGINYFMDRSVSKGAFNAKINLSLEKASLTIQLFDSSTKERYALFDMPNAHGAFIASLREEVQQIVEDIKTTCFETDNLKEKYLDWLKSRFGSIPDYPWPDTPDYCVFRCPNQKWYALVMKVKYRQLGLTGEEEVWVVNMKADSKTIPNLTDHKSIFPAWHMNKKHWITVLLTAVTNFERLQELTEKSYDAVLSKKQCIVPL